MTADVRKLTRSALLLALAIVMQILGRVYPGISQLVVGSTVNAILIICLLVNDVSWAVLVGALTPILAWSLGQLPQPLGPIIPIIALGNATFVVVLHLIRKISSNGLFTDIPGIILAALCKFVVIYLGSKLVLQLFTLSKIAVTLASKLMGVSQLITALIGGFAALILMEILYTRKKAISRNA